jgi:hypothetical protein
MTHWIQPDSIFKGQNTIYNKQLKRLHGHESHKILAKSIKHEGRVMQITKLFYCYAHEDKVLRDELAKHLAALKRLGLIDEWYDRDISAGKEWQKEIDKHLNTANVILLLISPDFVHSDYCYSIEMHQALLRHHAGTACVIPIILRPVTWEGMPFGQLQALPTEGKPIISWPKPDEAFYDVAQGIRKVIEDLTLRESTQGINTSQKAPQISKRISPFLKIPFQTHQQAPIKKTRIILLFVLSLLAVGISLYSLVVRQFPNSGNKQNIYSVTPKNHYTPNTTMSTQTTAAMPTTQVSCPSHGKARAAITASLNLGDHPTIVYVDNISTPSKPSGGTLHRYDTVTKQITQILKIDQSTIDEAQLSSDGRWIFFVSTVSGNNEVQMIRLDGQGLQTLYCTKNTIFNLLRSIGYDWLVFTESDPISGDNKLKLLTITDGTLIEMPKQVAVGDPITWDVYGRIYLIGSAGTGGGDIPNENVYILDPQTAKLSTFIKISGFCWSFSQLLDTEQSFVSQCSGGGGVGTTGPSNISTGLEGSSILTLHTLFRSSTLAITDVRAVSTDIVLLRVDGLSVTSQNGLWEMKADGTHLTRITGINDQINLNRNTQYPWSNVSLDGTMYAVESRNQLGSELDIGSLLNPTSAISFASIQDKTGASELNIVGWTTV